MMHIGEGGHIVDSSVFVAFFNKNDEYFQEAKEIFAREESPVVVLDAVLHESLALLRKRLSKKIALAAAKELLNSAFFKLYKSDMAVTTDALALFIGEKGKYSYADCVICVEAQLQKRAVLSFDPHFRELGLTVIP